jgi:hypothetical protein
VWIGEVGIEGRQCVGCVISFNKNSGMFMIRFDDALVVPMYWETVECCTLHFEDRRLNYRNSSIVVSCRSSSEEIGSSIRFV